MFQSFKNLLTQVEKRLDEVKDQSKNLIKVEEFHLPSFSDSVSPQIYGEGVSLEASDLLRRYEAALKLIHETGVANARKADETDALIAPAITGVRAETANIELFRRELDKLPEVVSRIETLKGQIDALGPKFEALEEILTQQICAYHSAQTTKLKENLSQEVEKYALVKRQELSSLQNELQIQKFQAEKQKEFAKDEQIRRQALEERARVEKAKQNLRLQDEESKRISEETAEQRVELERKAREELEEYKKTKGTVFDATPQGVIQFPPLRKAKPKAKASAKAAPPSPVQPTLSSVSLEAKKEDVQDLDSFLADVEVTSPPEVGSIGGEADAEDEVKNKPVSEEPVK